MLEPQTAQPTRGISPGESGGEILAFQLKKGLDLPIDGSPEQKIEDGPAITSCAVVGTDYHELKPKMMVAEGDTVHRGQVLFADRRFEGVVYTAPAGGRVRAINRGARRVLESVVIDIDEQDEPISFASYKAEEIPNLDRDRIKDNLLTSGLWTTLRTRPYSRVPDPESAPAAIFITAMDSSPLAPDAATVIGEAPGDFRNGVRLLAKLTDGTTYLCHRPDAEIPPVGGENVVRATFEGPHPAGLVGTHIHLLEPVHAEKTVWHANYQDVMAIGALFRTGHLPTERVISLAGPAAKRPRLIRSRVGASTATLVEGETADTEVRVIAGNVLTGRTADGPFAYLGRFHHQITLMEEGRKRELFGWLIPSMRKFSTANVHFSSLFGRGIRFPFNTSLNGSPRAMVPIGLYEDVIPLDILPTQLLRALLILDTEDAQALGCLELDEEDLALCSYVCLSKYEYGMALRANLKKIEAEG
ncbi:Na(+)-translocating NADH-quinone reductase subunit A [Denitrobaculum tricleocarpae]|uniref:Na(+)-translocating NADH-quinone reductase subunit A n=1 Tax=Denitrobaculum tricleocarpae TaxID=2591009 RepID=A0A545TB00_9PROT|nr:Na(+)-translocating NADH-quinone reductase subunit A [Denitrobaculum tricleocarpae]TQV74387.1 Na(+)-translocating NADH-quinone reductase subunit A [Denitrobaculum tricleocarpae]